MRLMIVCVWKEVCVCSFVYTRIRSARVCARVCTRVSGFKAEGSLNDMVEMERVTLD